VAQAHEAADATKATARAAAAAGLTAVAVGRALRLDKLLLAAMITERAPASAACHERCVAQPVLARFAVGTRPAGRARSPCCQCL